MTASLRHRRSVSSLLLLLLLGVVTSQCLSKVSSFLLQSVNKPFHESITVCQNTYYDEQEQELSAEDLVWNLHQDSPSTDTDYDELIRSTFPGALSNKDLEIRVVSTLAARGFTAANTLLATSLCCDELARRLEDDFVAVYGNNFNLGGLAGFSFAGLTGFENMALHTPDDGSSLIVFGPHVGLSTEGVLGQVERSGVYQVETCCTSAIAAFNYLQGITNDGVNDGGSFTDFEQGAVQSLLEPHVATLQNSQDAMLELPYLLYDLQDNLLYDIIEKGMNAGLVKNNIALLGGIQINTAPQALDYFLPLRFELLDNQGQVVEDLLDQIR